MKTTCVRVIHFILMTLIPFAFSCQDDDDQGDEDQRISELASELDSLKRYIQEHDSLLNGEGRRGVLVSKDNASLFDPATKTFVKVDTPVSYVIYYHRHSRHSGSIESVLCDEFYSNIPDFTTVEFKVRSYNPPIPGRRAFDIQPAN